MLNLIASCLAFGGIHLGVAGTRLRDRAVRALGSGLYMAAFSVASLAGIVWMVKAYQAADYVPTWGMLEGWKPVAIVLMLPAFLLVVMGLLTPNPTAVGQEGQLAAPPRGIVCITRHPFLVGVGIWALVHLVGNGDVASLVFFATWAVVAFAGTASIDAKRRRLLGAPLWNAFAAQTSILPFGAIAARRSRFDAGALVTWRLAAALLAYAVMLGGHAHIIGVSPFPG